MEQQIEEKKLKEIQSALIEANRAFSQEELSLISNTFNEQLLLVLRKFLFQGQLTENEKAMVDKMSSNDQTMDILERIFIPVIDPQSQFSSDIWLGLNTQEKGEGELRNDILSQLVLVRYLGQQLDRMAGRDKKYDYEIKVSSNQWENGNIKLKKLIPTGNEGYENMYVNLQARNWIINKVNGGCNQLNIFAIQHKEESEEDKEERLKQDSSK